MVCERALFCQNLAQNTSISCGQYSSPPSREVSQQSPEFSPWLLLLVHITVTTFNLLFVLQCLTQEIMSS